MIMVQFEDSLRQRSDSSNIHLILTTTVRLKKIMPGIYRIRTQINRRVIYDPKTVRLEDKTHFKARIVIKVIAFVLAIVAISW
jgi:hypothetical protein